jgi:hypothetical protein
MLSPFVLVVLLQGYGFTIDFYSLEACQAMERKLNSPFAIKAACGPRGEPIPAFEVQSKVREPHIAPKRRRAKVQSPRSKAAPRASWRGEGE